MKKTFPLQVPGNADARVIEAVKFEVRKYLKRERRKTIPAGFDQWDFACKVGPDQATAEPKPVIDVFAAIDAVAKAGSPQVFVEAISSPGKRFPASVAAPIAPTPIVATPIVAEPESLG
jgi:hypothetical protein